MDSDPPMTNHLTKSSDRLWSCTPSRLGLFVHDASDKGFFLPAPRRDGETVLPQPPLAVKLSSVELEDLLRVERPYAITRYGPEIQEKASNQDFALSALIEDGGGGKWCFGAVADGVSTATFWPERASRLACLASFQYFRDTLIQRSEVDLDDSTLLDHKRGLVTALRTSMEADHRHLRNHRSLVPPTFTLPEYQRRWHNKELWYKTTLLVGLIGHEHGFVFWSGDGGIWLRRQRGTQSADKRVLGSADGPLQSYVWLGVQEKDFSVGRIPLDDQEAATLALASDGLDRTLQQVETGYEELLPAGAPELRLRLLESRLDKVYGVEGRGSRKKPEPDNASLVVLEWDRQRHFSGVIEQPKRFPLAEVQAPSPTHPALPEPDPIAARGLAAGAPLPEPAHRPADPSLPQKPPLRGGAELTPEQMPPRKQRNAAGRRSRTLPVKVGIVFLAVVGLLVWLASHRPLSTGDSDADEAGDETQRGAPPGGTGSQTSKTAPAPVGSSGVNSADPQSLGQPPTRESTSAPLPTGPLEFAVLERGGLLVEAIGPPSQGSSAALVRELAEWSKQARALSASQESPMVTVVAYGDRNNPTLRGCRFNEEVARKRAEFFAELLQLFLPEVKVHAAWNACEAPPGISNPTSPEARRLVLFRGYRVVHCDCNDVSWANS